MPSNHDGSRQSPTEASHYRLVLYLVEYTVFGSLYALDAGPYSEPLFSFEVAPDQEIPPVEPRAIVEVQGEARKGTKPLIIAGGVRVLPATGLHEGAPVGWRGSRGSRLFAQNDKLVCHPSLPLPVDASAASRLWVSPLSQPTRKLQRDLEVGASVAAHTASEATRPFLKVARNVWRGIVLTFVILALATGVAALVTRLHDADLYNASELRSVNGRVVDEREDLLGIRNLVTVTYTVKGEGHRAEIPVKGDGFSGPRVDPYFYQPGKAVELLVSRDDPTRVRTTTRWSSASAIFAVLFSFFVLIALVGVFTLWILRRRTQPRHQAGGES